MSKSVKKTTRTEPDNVYFLKIIIYFILGLVWIKYNGRVIVPVGLILGIIIAQKDHFAIDRKVEYAILLISALFALSTANGFFLSFWGSFWP